MRRALEALPVLLEQLAQATRADDLTVVPVRVHHVRWFSHGYHSSSFRGSGSFCSTSSRSSASRQRTIAPSCVGSCLTTGHQRPAGLSTSAYQSTPVRRTRRCPSGVVYSRGTK